MSQNLDLNCNTLTFANLNSLVDIWASELSDWQNTFYMKSEELSRSEKEVSDRESKLKSINDKMNILYYLQSMVEVDINGLKMSQLEVEKFVDKVEEQIRSRGDCECPVDNNRKPTYQIAEQMNMQVKSCKEMINEVNLLRTSVKSEQGPLEYLAQILQKHMNLLELTESRILLLTKKLNESENVKRYALQKLHLKENKLYL